MKVQTKTGLLTAMAVVGFGLTIADAINQTPKALKLIDKRDSMKTKIRKTYKCYISTAILGATTCVAILTLGSNCRKEVKIATTTATYFEHAYRTYRNKVRELYGTRTDDEIISEIFKDQCVDPCISSESICGYSSLDVIDNDNPEAMHTFYEPISDRYFDTTLSNVLQAEYHLNRNYILGGCVSVNEFYAFLGLEDTDDGDDIGWGCIDYDGIYWIDFNHSKKMINGEPVVIIQSEFPPTKTFRED